MVDACVMVSMKTVGWVDGLAKPSDTHHRCVQMMGIAKSLHPSYK
jgi:hypothetical protein